MKKVILVLIIMLLFVGCAQNNYNSKYVASIKELRDMTKVEVMSLPFDINLKIAKNNESTITYTLNINNPQKPIYNITVLVINDYQNDGNYPSIGYNSPKLSLIPKVINKSSGYVKEIKLTGNLDCNDDIKYFDTTFKSKITYEDLEGNTYTYYYVKKV